MLDKKKRKQKLLIDLKTKITKEPALLHLVYLDKTKPSLKLNNQSVSTVTQATLHRLNYVQQNKAFKSEIATRLYR